MPTGPGGGGLRMSFGGVGTGAKVGWLLAALGVAAGYWSYGWPGVLLGITVVVFWLLLQFSQALRQMKAAAQRPIGTVRSAVMLQSKLQKGQRLADVMKLTGSFGKKLAPDAAALAQSAGAEVETYAWADNGDDAVWVTFTTGRVTAWALQRSSGGSGEASSDA